jgi:hypothetical protein
MNFDVSVETVKNEIKCRIHSGIDGQVSKEANKL